MMTLPRGKGKGEWWLLNDQRHGEAILSASIHCPICDHKYYLDHTIASDGTVTPSLVCPSPNCTFHENVRLDGWPHGPKCENP